MTSEAKVPKILHLHSTFAPGGKELRAVQLMNAFGDELSHTVVSGMPEQMGARDHIAHGVKADFPADFPSLTGLPTPGRMVAIAKAMKPFDLVLTYNWGAMNAVMAHTVFCDPLKLPPLIHHEDGFNEDEADQLKSSRNWFRRIALRRTHQLVVPSRVLEQIAHTAWQQPREQVSRIPNGIASAKFASKPDPSGFRVVKRKGELWVGTLAGLRPVKQLTMMVRAFAGLPENWQLVILGEGPDREAIKEAADDLEVSHRVHLPGAVTDPERLIGMFDIFALSSKSEQFPLSVVEAMAAGLPVAAPDVGDIRMILSESNRALIAAPDNMGALAEVLETLAIEPELRARLGKANRERATEHFDQGRMIASYHALYWGALSHGG